MAKDDPRELSEALERQADEMAREGREVKQTVDETREDWERKRRDESVPGATPPESDEADDPGQADDA